MRNSVFITTIMLLFYCSVTYGQISTEEEPISFLRTNVPALRISERTMKSFESLDFKKIEQEDRAEYHLALVTNMR